MTSHHAFALEAEPERGIEAVAEHLARERQKDAEPEVVVLRYELLSVDDARDARTVALAAPTGKGGKAVVIAATRAYHEAQNALLKLFEEPPPQVRLFLILPDLGELLPTLRSRVQVLPAPRKAAAVPEAARTFIDASPEHRSAIVKKLASGKDEDERRKNRDEALVIVNGIEAALYRAGSAPARARHAELFSEIAFLRECLRERGANMRMILEHLAIVLPKGLGKES